MESPIVTCLTTIHGSRKPFEIRVITQSGATSGFFSSISAAEAEIRRMDEKQSVKGIYTVLNPFDPAKHPVTNKIDGKSGGVDDDEVTAYHWIPIDVDPIRYSEKGEVITKPVSSTDEERERARQKALEIRDYLASQFNAKGLLISSGNGYQLLYPCSWPAREGKPLMVALLRALKGRFSDGSAEVDTKVSNPSRIWKVWGTVARKGPNQPKRPWRRAEGPEALELNQVVTLEEIKSCLLNMGASLPKVESEEEQKEKAAKRKASGKPVNKGEKARGKPQIDFSAIKGGEFPSAMEMARLPGAKVLPGGFCIFEEPTPIKTPLRPCFMELIAEARRAEGEEVSWSHSLRLAIAKDMIFHGWGDEDALDVFRLMVNFNEGATLYQLESLREGLGVDWFKPSPCRHLREGSDEGMEPSRELADGARCRDCSLLFGPKLTKGQMLYTCAQMLLSQYDLVTLEDTNEILVYEGGVYKRNVAAALAKDSLHVLHEKANALGRNEVLGFIRTETTITRDDFDNFGEGVLNVKNGLLDINNMVLMPHSPKHLSVNQLPVSYDPNAKCPMWLEFLNQVLAKEEERASLQEFFGYVFFDGYPIHKALLMVGSGRNGKGTIIRILEALIGSENCESLALHQLEDRFMVSYLWAKMANLGGDIPSTMLRDTSRFKGLTGGDVIKCDVKNKGAIRLQNRAKMVFSANKIPKTEDDEAAFFARWLILEFLRTFEGEEDNDLTDKLKTELPGILLWAIEGYQRLKKNGRFTLDRSSVQNAEMWEEYVEAPQGVKDFIDECLVSSKAGKIRKEDLRLIYEAYCLKWGFKNNQNGLFSTLRRMGYKETKNREGDIRVRYFSHIDFVDDIEARVTPSQV